MIASINGGDYYAQKDSSFDFTSYQSQFRLRFLFYLPYGLTACWKLFNLYLTKKNNSIGTSGMVIFRLIIKTAIPAINPASRKRGNSKFYLLCRWCNWLDLIGNLDWTSSQKLYIFQLLTHYFLAPYSIIYLSWKILLCITLTFRRLAPNEEGRHPKNEKIKIKKIKKIGIGTYYY